MARVEEQISCSRSGLWNRHLKRHGIGRVLLIFLLTRLTFYGAGLIGIWALPEAAEEKARVSINGPLALAMSWHFDAVHYYSIAVGGYNFYDTHPMPGNNPGVLPAFFPLLPLLIRAMATVLRGFRAPLPLPISDADPRVLLAGVLASHVLSLLAFWLLYRLAYEETDDESTARRAVLYTAIFPLAFYYAVPYTEALFLAASVGTFLAVRRGNWIQAGLWAAIASAARLAGVLLLPVLMLEIAFARRRGEMRAHAWPRALLGLLLAPAGLLLYMLYQSRYTGDPLAFLHAQANWNRKQVFPLVTLWRGISYAIHPSWSPNGGSYGRGIMNTVIVLGFLLVTVASLRRWRPSYVLYGVLLFTLSLLSPLQGAATMQSVGRYVMVFFPAYFTLAHWGRRPSVNLTILLICLPLLSLFTALYVRWYFLG